MSDLSKMILSASGIKTETQFKIACIFGNHGLPMIGDLDVRQTGDPLELADAIQEEVPSYNDFRGSSVAEAIRMLHEKGLIMNVSFGREGSPVLYVEPPYWTGQASNLDKLGKDWDKAHGQSRSYSEIERKRMFQEILTILAGHTRPDELGWMRSSDHGSYENGPPTPEAYKVRAWWD